MRFDKKHRLHIALSRMAEKNPMWKGNNVGYAALHAWIKKRLIKPQACQACNQVKPLDLANISQEYKRDLSDWEWLCRKCHMVKDNRINNLQKGAIRTGQYLNCLICKKVIYRQANEIKEGLPRFCSISCTNKGRWRGLTKGKIGSGKWKHKL